MARRSGFTRALNAIARQAARSAREAEASRKHHLRELERAEREAQRFERERLKRLAATSKEAQRQYLEARSQEVNALNRNLAARLEELQGILGATLTIDDHLTFDSLKLSESFPAFQPLRELLETGEPPKPETVKPLGALERLIPGNAARHEKLKIVVAERHAAALQRYESGVLEKANELKRLHSVHEQARIQHLNGVRARNQEIADFEAAYTASDPNAVTDYCAMVLERSQYPEGFPQRYRLAYVPEPKELVVEYELPDPGIVPDVVEYKYVKTRDEVDQKPRKAAEVKMIYQDLVSAVVLRTIHELLEADRAEHLQVITLNGILDTVDPSTGKDLRRCVVSVRTTRAVFNDLNLARITDKQKCLRSLGAQVSPRPEEMIAVKPVVEFDMVDKRFVEQSDLLSDIESRPNLMELTPTEFEHVVSNLFSKMGLETKLTRSSRDGGVDAVAFDTRPVLGGKVVIQAKRYKNTVGVSSVRDLYGTMLNEGASKGILVATSSYGSDAYEFAKDKPLELIDGGGLLYLMDQVGVKAKIVMPED